MLEMISTIINIAVKDKKSPPVAKLEELIRLRE